MSGQNGRCKSHPIAGHEGPEGQYRYRSITSLTSTLEWGGGGGGGGGGQRHAPYTLPPGKKPGAHYTGGWVDTRAGPDGWEKSGPHRDSIPGPHWDSIPGPSSP